MANYRIQIHRTKTSEGRLNYHGSFSATFPCWWDPEDQIPSGVYAGCSKTYLNSKENSKGGKREGIYLANVPGRKGIFIHYWPGPGPGNDLSVWSDGCTVVTEPDMLRMWNDITPSDAGNVTIEVRDVVPSPPKHVTWPTF